MDVKGWETIKDRQQEVVRFLINSYQKNRLVHAYILEGPKGVGKLFVAKNFAKMLFDRMEIVLRKSRFKSFSRSFQRWQRRIVQRFILLRMLIRCL